LGSSGERLDALALDHLEGTLRHVAEELAGWRARALKAEAEARHAPAPATAGPGLTLARPDPELRTRMADLEAENRILRQRVEVTRARVHDLLARLAFLEEQGRETSSGSAGAAGAVR